MDVGKGILVLVMLLHHAWSAVYISGDDSMRGVLSFVSSAFILFSGFLFGSYLLNAYLDSPLSRGRKDMKRGVRLLSIYLTANALLYFIDYRGIGEISFHEWLLTCIQLNPPEIVVFSLLNAFGFFFIAIAMVFMLTICFAKLSGLNAKIMVFCVVSVIFTVLAQHSGMSSNNLLSSTTVYGFLGVILAMIVNRIPSLYNDKMIIIGSAGGVGYLMIALLTFYGAVNPYSFYMSFVLLGSLAVWRLSVWLEGRPNNLFVILRFLGKYTLLAYLVQVIVSQLISLRVLNIYVFSTGVWQTFILSSIIMTFIMIGILFVTDRLRKFSGKADYVYRLVFG